MESNQKIYKILQKKYGIRSCKVVLNRLTFSKMKIKCTVKSSDENEKFSCVLTEEKDNIFSIKIKRKFLNESDTAPRKKQKLLPGAEEIKNIKRDNKKIVAKPAMPKPTPIENAKIGQVLLCKLKCFCPWPAFVTEVRGGLISVEFFGDHTKYTGAIKNFYKFEDSSETIIANLRGRKNPLYRKSVLEAEVALGIPTAHSILNRITI